MTSYLWLIFLAGLAGSMHCVGMCGGFVCALGPDRRGAVATSRRHLLYHAGRLTSYVFLGALAGGIGMLLVGRGGEAAVQIGQRLLAGVSGLLVLLVGLQFLGLGVGVLPGGGVLGHAVARGLSGLRGATGPSAPVALGVINGLLPCPLVYAFVAQAGATCGTATGLQVMLAFGLGTLPAMLAAGGIGVWVRRNPRPVSATGSVQIVAMPGAARPAVLGADWRHHALRLAGVFLLFLGLLTLARGLWPTGMHQLMGH